MTPPNAAPGPDAHRAFRLGMIAASFLALVAVGTLHWIGVLSLEVVAFTILVGFPIYLLYVASLLSVWLGFDKDPTNLRTVYRDREQTRTANRRRL